MKNVLNPFFYASNPELLAYENEWIKFVKYGIEPLESIISNDIFMSWKHCRGRNFNPLSREQIERVSANELKRKQSENSALLNVAEKYMKTIFEIVKESGAFVGFFDSNGCLIYSQNAKTIEALAFKTGLIPGCLCSEAAAGTNAVSMAINTGKPSQLSGAQNYLQQFHNWTCSAAPVVGEKGKVLGVIMTGNYYEALNQHTLGMVSAVASAIENELRIINLYEELKSADAQRQTLFSMVTDGVIYVIDGVVRQINEEMSSLLGLDADEIIGKKVGDVIRATPEIDKIFRNEGKEYGNKEIAIEGKVKVYKCLFDVKRVEEPSHEEYLFLVTRIDEIRSLTERITNVAETTFDDIIAVSSPMKEVIETAKLASTYNSRVLLQGESGTGKELLAQSIHNGSTRKYNSFVAVDCGAIPKELFESELFGYERGAFTGAKNEGKAGLLELADKGTLFLDEIANMPIEMQAKLLRVLQEGTITKVGGIEKINVDVRVIAATNTDIKKAIEAGEFREDLYYRLNVININVPPLRERKKDIPCLIQYFIEMNETKKGGPNKAINLSEGVMHTIMQYDWPGNIRQLQNFVERLAIMNDGNEINEDMIPLEMRAGDDSVVNQSQNESTLEEMTEKYIESIVKKCNGNISKAADILGVSRVTIYNKLKKMKKTVD